MAQLVRDAMTTDPIVLDNTDSLDSAAKRMRDDDIGDVLVKDDGGLCGIVTDRDIVIRALADGKDPQATTLADVCSHELDSVAPDDEVEAVVAKFRERAIRRVPVLDDGVAVGILSIGDLAVRRDPDSALSDISAAPGNE